MSKRLTHALAWLVVAAAGGALAAPAPSSPPQQARPGDASPAVSLATAKALARVVAPMEIMVPVEIEQARKAILVLPTMDDDAKQLEQDYPGLYAALWAAVEPELRRQVIADYPSFWTALEELYVARLTEREAQTLIAFFQSATGQKLMRSMYGSFDATPLFAEMVKSDSAKIEADQMKAATDAAKAKAVKELGPEDEAALLKLVESIDLNKFKAFGAETQKVTLDWVNKEDPEGEQKLEKMMVEAMERYIAAHPTKE